MQETLVFRAQLESLWVASCADANSTEVIPRNLQQSRAIRTARIWLSLRSSAARSFRKT
jgi:hypothetical protein